MTSFVIEPISSSAGNREDWWRLVIDEITDLPVSWSFDYKWKFVWQNLRFDICQVNKTPRDEQGTVLFKSVI